MSVMTEVFSNPVAATTVSSGGTTAPTAGTVETWTMAGGFASWPAVSNTAVPPQVLRISDATPGFQTETMWVTNIAGSTWTVTRGAEGTTTIAHTAGFSIQNIVTAATLANMLQASQGSPLAGVSLGTSAPYNTAISTTETLILALPIKPANIKVGSTFLLVIQGGFTGTATATTVTMTARAGTAGTKADQTVATALWNTGVATTLAPTTFIGLFTVTSIGATGNINGLMTSLQGPNSLGATPVVGHQWTATTGWNTATATFLDITLVTSGASSTFTPWSASLLQVV